MLKHRLLCRKQAEFLAVLSALERAPEAQSLPLQSFLILPMQYITRLPLLVDAVLHQLDTTRPNSQTSEDYVAVCRCLESLHWVSPPACGLWSGSERTLCSVPDSNLSVLVEFSSQLVLKLQRVGPKGAQPP